MIREYNQNYVLETDNTTYCFRVLPTGHLEHLYYGRKITLTDDEGMKALVEKHTFMPGNTNAYDQENTAFSLEDIRLEMSSYGKGDIREPFIEVIHADGSYTSDFLFESAQITKGKEAYDTLPASYDEAGETDHLCIVLKDRQYALTLELHYYVYEDCDVIARSARLINDSEEEIKLMRLMSAQIDYDTPEYVFTT
ncbi:MAG: hypothetical protein K2K07_16365 [Lachnospiraceae bacterium]|nr:hypothetical protein [Lachnospiraceae bacterium]